MVSDRTVNAMQSVKNGTRVRILSCQPKFSHEMICRYCQDIRQSVQSLVQHEIRCKQNPDRLTNMSKGGSALKGKKLSAAHREKLKRPHTEATKKKLKEIAKNRVKISEDTKKKISTSLKKAHAEGRAWNIGKSRWNNEPSYPEKFFSKVIENEFQDKEYSREYAVGKYSIDFAWYQKKLAIEIDGDQHQRFQEYIERDAKKDALLISEGWEILRIKWKDMFHNPEEWIKKSYDFIHRA